MQEQQRAKLLQVRKRLRDDFSYYAPRSLKIRTKTAEIIPFTPNRAQLYLKELIDRQLATTGRVRIIIPKARQLGLSTFVGAWMYWWVSQRKAQKALVVTHKSESTRALFDMTKRFHENVPEILRPHTKYSSRAELMFDQLDSSYMVATAGGEAIARGETITCAHLSEMAWWPPGFAKENLGGILQAIPDVPGTAVFIESTANGVTGPFYEMTQGALKGENGYDVCFLPWFWDDSYRSEAPANFERTPEEEDLASKWDLDNDQLQFRRRKIAQTGIDQWNQEYPTVLDDAFLTSGRPVFNIKVLNSRLQESPDIHTRMALQGDHMGAWEKMEWEEHHRGELLVYEPIDPGETYYIGADVAMGVQNGDWSVAQVLDSKKRQVAIWRSQVHPDYFAYVLFHLGKLYNFAKIAVESNNHGLLTVNNLYKYLAYPNVHTDVIEDKVTDRDTVNLGFRTTAKSRPLVIDDLRAALRDKELILYDKTTIRELMTFVVTESGKLEHDAGCHDDCVMALAIANHIHEGVMVPVQVTDDYYVEAL
jgi:hypothetical protein